MPNTKNRGYENFVLEDQLQDILETNLSVQTLMTIDDSLVESEGMIKKINVYKYEGEVEELEEGQGNTTTGAVTFETKTYEVALAQHRFGYHDEQFMQDSKVVDYGVRGAGLTMINHMNDKFFEELESGEITKHEIAGATLKYDDVIDAMELLENANTLSGATVEDESKLFLLVGTDFKANLRKDPDFKSANQGAILFNGQIGTVAGIPVIGSRKVPAKTAYLMTKEAITLFIKKETEAEQSRDANTRYNEVYLRKVFLVALTDATKVVCIHKGE